jgi:hypothetical protein
MSVNGTSDEYIVANLARIADSLKRMGAVAQQPNEPQSSVQIEQAAKPGQPPRITVKAYAADINDAATLAGGICGALIERYAQPEASA